MSARQRRGHKAMARTQRAIRRYNRTGNPQHIVAAVLSIGRTMARTFAEDEARWPTKGERYPAADGEALCGYAEYCSDRWSLGRYQRAKMLIAAGKLEYAPQA